MSQFQRGDHRGGSDVALTPPYIIEALGGPRSFDLDPCACPNPRPWDTARHHVSLPDDGLAVTWSGRVWLNQPYSEAARWAERLAKHRDGIMLVYARTGTRWFQETVWRGPTSAVLFLQGRLGFFDGHGQPIRTKRGLVSRAGAPSCLVAYDPPGLPQRNAEALVRAVRAGDLTGHIIPSPASLGAQAIKGGLACRTL